MTKNYLKIERHKMVPAVYLIVKNKKGKLLGILRRNTGYMDGHWSLPSGHVEKGELPLKGVVRETLEEVNLTIEPKDLKLVHLMTRPEKDSTGERIDIFFETTKWSGKPENNELGKHEKVEWVSVEDTLWIPNQKYVILQINNGSLYSEFYD